MKTEINLRTREFAVNREFYWPRLLKALAVILLVVIFLGGSLFVYLYQMQLAVANNYLTQEKTSLQAKVAPVEEMEAQIRNLEQRERLSGSLIKGVICWSDHFRMVNRIAKGLDVGVTSQTASGGDQLRLTGSGPSMEQAALFMQALEEQENVGAVDYKYMTYTQDEDCNFELELTLAGGGEQ